MAMIRVEALGGLRVLRDGAERRTLPGKLVRAALLVILAIEREVSRERVCLLLWPDSAPDKGRHALSQTLHELKKELEDGWFESVGERLRATESLEADVHELVDAAAEGRHGDVLELHRGPFLEGVRFVGGVDFERWVEDERKKIHKVVRVAFREVTSSTPHPDRRAEVAAEWVRLDPLDDEAQHALIEALSQAGRRNEALERYREYRDLIREELGVEPLEQTEELVERIRAGGVPRSGSDDEEDGGEAEAPPPTDEPDRERPTERDPGARLPDDLHVVRPLGLGATGSVYLAREPDLRRRVAVKVLDRELAGHPIARARFVREAQSAARILHPHVAVVYRNGETVDGVPFYVMQYIKGFTLADRIKAVGPLPAQEVRRLLAEAASALAAAHATGVVHRDVRPGNLLYEDETGSTYLVDFGMAAVLESGGEEMAKLTRTGELLGNPEYISPEQRAGRPVDDRSDVYSLGVMGRELLFGRTDDGSIDERQSSDTALLDLLRRTTSENPRHRPHAAELADALAAGPPKEEGWSLFGQLKNRRMFPIVGAYTVGGWGGVSVIDQLTQQEIFAPVAYRLALAFFVAGLNAVIVVGWFHGEKGRQRVSRAEVALLTVIFVAWVVASALML